MPKVIITGHSRGLGKVFYDHFINKGWEVIGYNKQTGLDIASEHLQNCDLFINNAYADGIQKKFLENFHSKVNKMIICGSVAAFYPDPRLPKYSQHKKELVDTYRKINSQNILMLHLSAKGYNDSQTIMRFVDLWLEGNTVREIFFDPTGEPNE